MARIITVNTSATTGEKKRIYFTAGDMQATEDFFTYGMAPMIAAGETCTVLMNGAHAYTIGGLLETALTRLGAKTVRHGNPTDLDRAAEACRDAACIVGLPNDLAALAACYPKLRPKNVLLSGDYAAESVIARLRSTWGCTVFMHWGMTETGYGGAVTQADGGLFHIRRDLLIEIVDPETGEPLPEGAPGEIVVTTPERRGMPLTRYRTGDIGTLVYDRERGRLALADLRGRYGDEQSLPGGGTISIHRLDEILYAIPGLVCYSAALSKTTLRIGVAGDVPYQTVIRAVNSAYPQLKVACTRGEYQCGKRRLVLEGEDCHCL